VQLPEWQQYTIRDCPVKVFQGGHFFIKDRESEVRSLRRCRGWTSHTLTPNMFYPQVLAYLVEVLAQHEQPSA
jgi:hypothetical protein